MDGISGDAQPVGDIVQPKLLDALRLISAFRDMHEIEQDAAKKQRIRDAATDLVDAALPHAERAASAMVEQNDTP